jgi:hypothetical protein
MKNLTNNQIEVIKNIQPFTFAKFHGNKKTVNGIPVAAYINIVKKKGERELRKRTRPVSKFDLIKELISECKRTAGTPYFKMLILGNTSIYFASPEFGHKDYNKSRVMDATPENIKLMNVVNSLISKS